MTDQPTTQSVSNNNMMTDNIVSVLPNIFPFFTFEDINTILLRVNSQWCLQSLRFLYQLLHTPNRCCLFNNIVFDASTGSRIFDFNDIKTIRVVFDTLYRKHFNLTQKDPKRLTLLYTHVPIQYQNTEPVAHKKNDPSSLPSNDKNNALFQNVVSSGSSSSTSQLPQSPSSPALKPSQGSSNSLSSTNGGQNSTNLSNFAQQQNASGGSGTTNTQPTSGTATANNPNSNTTAAPKGLCGEEVTHMFPLTAFNDSPDLGYQFTNYSCLYLYDGHFVFVLYGNILGCFDLLGHVVRWSELVDEKLPTSRRVNYMFVNAFTQTENSIIVQLPQQVVCFNKKNGMKVNLILNDPITKFHMINEKRERVCCVSSFTEIAGNRKDEHFDGMCVLIGENIVRDKSIDFTKLTSIWTEEQTKQVGEARSSRTIAFTGLSPSAHDSHPSNALVPFTITNTLTNSRDAQHLIIAPVTSSEITQTTSGTQKSYTSSSSSETTRRTPSFGFIEKPKLYIFDGNTLTVTVSASGQSRDRQMLFRPKKSPVFCILNEYEGEMRIVNREGKRTHIINLKKICGDPKSKQLKQLPFRDITNWHFLVGEKPDIAIIQPDIGRILHLKDLLPSEISPDKIFIVEKQTSETRPGISRLDGIVTIQKEEKLISYYEFVESSSSILEGTFQLKWSQTLSWKKDAQFMFEFSHIQHSISAPLCPNSNEESRVLVFSRQVIDQRRFLTIQQRLDIQLIAVNMKDGSIRWQKVHECYHGSGGDLSEAEKGFDISFCKRFTCKKGDDKLVITNPQLCLVRSFFSPMIKPDKGVAICVAYKLEDGEILWNYNEKRKGAKIADDYIFNVEHQKGQNNPNNNTEESEDGNDSDSENGDHDGKKKGGTKNAKSNNNKDCMVM
ncbi:hypothetical protein C9374_010329 [Naegleria lovaniensis]|uniref:Uncharacterized protein n=1 Tax=Naegleria lovaniensis TaxID=51637 RepID=A0AA88GCB0_NAELO|nr:uncharacterized protein C9374_010329 [Naegleria lovaniensis]KAG2374955.1 hypothetical protein C9374_010329 [Naegleria lovaniensis]